MSHGSKKSNPKIRSLFADHTPLSQGQNRIINLFFRIFLFGTFAAMLGIILYYIYAFASLYYGSERFSWLLGIFSDFVEIMNFSLKDTPYITNGSSYPPVAVMVLYPFALICKNVFASYSGQGLTVDELTSRVILHAEFWIAIVLFFLICISSIIFIIVKKYKLDLPTSIKVGAIIIFSAPSVYAIMRGNTIYFALIFLLLFLLLYEHPKAWVRELSYLCLVISGLIKIYPLFFGVYLLRKKKIFESFRVAIYFGLLFFLSFNLFKTELAGMNLFIDNLSGFMFSDNRLLSMRNLSFSSLIYKLFYIISPSSTASAAYSITTWAFIILIFVTSTVTATATRSNFSRSVIASSVIILIPTISYFYVLIFAIIPFMEFIFNYDSLPKNKRIAYAWLYLFMFFTFFILPQCFIPHLLVIAFMLVCEEITVIKYELIPYFKKRKEQRSLSSPQSDS